MTKPESRKKIKLPNIGNIFRETKSELKKVVWPGPKQIKNNSIIVIVSILVAGVAVAIMDVVFKLLFDQIIQFIGR